MVKHFFGMVILNSLIVAAGIALMGLFALFLIGFFSLWGVLASYEHLTYWFKLVGCVILFMVLSQLVMILSGGTLSGPYRYLYTRITGKDLRF